MKGLSKVLSIVLILGAVLGFYGGAVNIKDVLACQDYWEEQGEITDENLGKLEDGIAQLEENEEAYVQGVADYEKGQADLAAGKQELAEGKATLTAKTKELNDGKATLAASAKTIANGEAALKKLEKLEQAMAAFQNSDGMKAYSAGYATALNASKELLNKIKAYGNTLVSTGNTLITNGNDLITRADAMEDTNSAKATTKATGEAYVASGDSLVSAGEGLLKNVNAFSTNDQLKNAPVYGFKLRLDANDTSDPNNPDLGFLAILDSVSTALDGKTDDGSKALKANADGLVTECNAWKNNTSYQYYYNAIQSSDTAAKTLAGYEAPILQNILAAGLITDTAKATALTPYATASYITLPDNIMMISNVFTQVQQGIDAKKQELANGKAQYAAGEKKIADGEKQLAAGKVTLANGEATVADGEKQLAEGEAKLAEYEDGEAQLMAGLDTLLASETYSGLKSIKARLGKNFSYMQDNNKNLDLEKASLAVQTGRDFSADSSVKITKEIKTRAIGQGVGLFGAVLALVAGIVGLSKKNKTAGILALLAAVSAIAGIVVFNGAGFEMSEIAGSTLTGMSAIYAMVVVAVAGVLGGIAHLSIKKDAE